MGEREARSVTNEKRRHKRCYASFLRRKIRIYIYMSMFGEGGEARSESLFYTYVCVSLCVCVLTVDRLSLPERRGRGIYLCK